MKQDYKLGALILTLLIMTAINIFFQKRQVTQLKTELQAIKVKQAAHIAKQDTVTHFVVKWRNEEVAIIKALQKQDSILVTNK